MKKGLTLQYDLHSCNQRLQKAVFFSQMMTSRFLKNVSSNTLQTIVNQVFGVAIFYALSKGISKEQFGQINWALAVLLCSFGILGFGMDQVMVRKIAAGYNRRSVFSAYFHHVLVSGFLFYGLLLIFYFFFPGLISEKIFLLFIGFGKLAIYFTSPVKQLSVALEKFRDFARMSVVSNIVRGSVLLILLFFHKISVTAILITFISGDLLELGFSYFISRNLLQKPFFIRWNRKKRLLLMRESLPQTGVVFFTAIMSRLDWILIGLIVSGARLAEYSFAYKLFELSTLPLLIIAPVMIPLFTRMEKQSPGLDALSFFLEWQVILACGTAMLLNICWIPVVDFISDGKYGTVNARTIFLLSLSIPLLYFSNYLWTIRFARGNMKLIFLVMAISLAVNIIACALLIPYYKNEGAALAYFITAGVQTTLYFILKPGTIQPLPVRLLLWPLSAFVFGFLSFRYIRDSGARVAVAGSLFLILAFLCKSIRLSDWRTLQSLYK